jgi:hypothetical protein
MASVISVPYTILMDSGIVEGQPPEGPFAVVKFKCATADRYQLVQDLVGTSVKAGNAIVRTYPFSYPPSPNLVCRAIESIEQRGLAFPLPGGPVWVGRVSSIVTARFELARYFADGSDPSGQPYTQTTFDASGEVLSAPLSTYKFPGGVPTNAPIGIIIPHLTITLKRFLLPFLPVREVASLIGHVNNAVVSIGGFDFPAGTLLFLGGPSTVSSDTLGNVLYEAEYRMAYRPYPWNQFLNPNGTSGFQAVADGNGNPPYPSGDFTSLP